MDSPAVTQLFRQLFRQPHPACLARRNLVNLATAVHHRRQLRALSSGRGSDSTRGTITASEKERGWQQRRNAVPKERSEELERYPLVTAKELRSYKERPRRVRMLMRDFIEGASSRQAQARHAKLTVPSNRQPLQPILRLLLQTSRHFYPRQTFLLPPHPRRARVPLAPLHPFQRVRRYPRRPPAL